MLQAYEGYLQGGQIHPLRPLINTQERRRVIITVLDEPHREDAQQNPTAWLEDLNRLIEESKAEEKKLRLEWLDRLEESVRLSMDEELNYIPRTSEMRNPLGLID